MMVSSSANSAVKSGSGIELSSFIFSSSWKFTLMKGFARALDPSNRSFEDNAAVTKESGLWFIAITNKSNTRTVQCWQMTRQTDV